MGEITKPVRPIGEQALIIVCTRGRLRSAAGDRIVAHVGEAVAKGNDRRDLISLRSAAGADDYPQCDHSSSTSHSSKTLEKASVHRLPS